MYMYIYAFIYIYTYLSLYVYVYIHVYVYVHMYISTLAPQIAQQDLTFALLQHLYGKECVDCDVRDELLLRHGLVFRSAH